MGAFIVNTTVGVGGLLDAGQWVGLTPQPADFGQTLALVGVGNGPYLVIPILGPSTLRDGVGEVVDRFFHPLTYLIGITPHLMWGGGVGVSRRAEADAKLKVLEESSLDFYSVLRSAYVQTRQHSIDALRDDDEVDLAASEAPDGGDRGDRAVAPPAARAPGRRAPKRGCRCARRAPRAAPPGLPA